MCQKKKFCCHCTVVHVLLSLTTRGKYKCLLAGLGLTFLWVCLCNMCRYIISNKSVSRSSSACSSDESARSQRSTSAALSSRSSDQFLGEYATYYKSWRELATSKTEQDAARMLLLDSLADPSFRLRNDAEPARRSLQGNAVGGCGEAQSQAANKTKQKRQQHLERMKRAWRITDSGATVHNEMSAEDFLHGNVGKQGHQMMTTYGVGALSPPATPTYVSTHTHTPCLNSSTFLVLLVSILTFLFPPGQQSASGRAGAGRNVNVNGNVDMLHNSSNEKRYTCMMLLQHVILSESTRRHGGGDDDDDRALPGSAHAVL
jgi:hypothetical protein